MWFIVFDGCLAHNTHTQLLAVFPPPAPGPMSVALLIVGPVGWSTTVRAHISSIKSDDDRVVDPVGVSARIFTISYGYMVVGRIWLPWFYSIVICSIIVATLCEVRFTAANCLWNPYMRVAFTVYTTLRRGRQCENGRLLTRFQGKSVSLTNTPKDQLIHILHICIYIYRIDDQAKKYNFGGHTKYVSILGVGHSVIRIKLKHTHNENGCKPTSYPALKHKHTYRVNKTYIQL